MTYRKEDTDIYQPENEKEALHFYRQISLPVEKRMTEADKTKWVEALRSGKYKQATGRLCDVDSGQRAYCCLGVYAEIQGVKYNYYGEYSFPIDSRPFTWPESKVLVDEWAKTHNLTNTGKFTVWFTLFNIVFYKNYELAVLNDAGFTFDQIADVIEYFF